MDGFEVLRRLRGAERPVPVLVSPPAMPVLLKGPELRYYFPMDSVDIEVLRSAEAWRGEGRGVTLGTIVKTWGSAPRPVGAMVAIRDDGQVMGSVSGGCVEDDLIEKVTAKALAAERPQLVTYGVTNEEATRWGLPCGGTLQLVLEPVSEQSRIAELLERISKQQLVRRRLDMASGSASLEPGRWQDVLEFDGKVLSAVHGPRWRMVLIGAGQLTRYLAEMARMLDYHVVVIEPREEYAAGWDLASVPLDRAMPDDVLRETSLDGHSAVVALTHDPKIDDLALMEALKSAAFYVGAIGSKKNNDARRVRLREFDLSDEEIARLRGPVGLYIGSKTPPEIAVAILAEMTAVRHGVAEPSWAAKPERRFDPSACEVKPA
jgi:xanthine dehydrogenase accessory factor